MPRLTRLAGPLLAGLALLSLSLPAQDPAHDPAHDEGHPEARPEDVATIEAIVAAMYDVVSGPAGERDWKRFESLFVEEVGRFTPIAPGGTHVESWTPRDYQARLGAFYLQNATYQKEIASRVERYGPLAQVFSTYELREAPDAEPAQRGINAFHLFFDGDRWWILSVAFTGEAEGQPIPARYLK